MMNRPTATLLVLLALTTVASAPAQARGLPQEGSAQIESELAGIRAALQDIATLMRQQLAASNRDSLLRRIEIKNARLVPIETALRGVREQLENHEAQRSRMETRAQELEEILFYAEEEEQKAQARIEQKEMLAFAEQIGELMDAAQAREMEVARERDALNAEIDELERRLDAPPR
jgi:chromosome segregation ATPase